MKNLNTKISGGFMTCLVLCSIVITGCNNHDTCIKCNAAFANQKNVKEIKHTDSEGSLKEKFTFRYKENLIDSIIKVVYIYPDDSTITYLKVYYPAGGCVLSSYIAKTHFTNELVTTEKGFMTLSGEQILNRHRAFYNEDDRLFDGEETDVDYTYNGNQVATRNGTDYGFWVGLNKYANENSYVYTGDNITKVVTQEEQAGYKLDIIFDGNNNPFNIQGGVLYYLALTSYPQEEYYNSIPLDRNNPTTITYKGTDGVNDQRTTIISFAYTYDAAHYPITVGIKEATNDRIIGSSTLNRGVYHFSYY